MPFYQDILTGDILLEDFFAYKEVDSVVYEVENSTEAVALRSGDGSTIDFAHTYAETFSLEPVIEAFGPQEYLSAVEKYIDSVGDKVRRGGCICNDHSAKRAAAMSFLRNKLLPNFDRYDLFTGPSTESAGMIVLRGFRDDGVTPYFILWKNGLTEMDEED